MGRVRTKTVKKAARLMIEKYYPRLTLDFDTNKKICDEVAAIPSKRLRNKIAGFVTHLMKRIKKGPVRGISFKLQEEERERKDNYVPDVSALQVDLIEVDSDTKDMLRSIGLGDLAGVQVVSLENLPSNKPVFQHRGERRDRGERRERGERSGAPKKPEAPVGAPEEAY
ncbi:ribosomal protein S17, putative [Acanthamoeba castellanii str. Neff]|uniref:Ribosomal protein S17, putative n=1 Tax=Acanthamoeba castellanii (strain ATCC 30010 / Neff) TaxID=1257118 RepID=L8HA34_ACACF|nr:ribosomal protein S17, putative [Acanthamoeba castellanii str. Neff]ELR21296.1 ribosomal protein S17, putative [Acanthamoeba castellanii str. Neff]